MVKRIILKLQLIFIPCLENGYRPRFLESKFLFYYLLFLLILKLITVSYLIYLPRTIFFADLSRTTLIKLTNQGRQSLGLEPLKENPQLDRAAHLKAQDMIVQDYFSHQSPEGRSPWYWFGAANYNYQYAGENLAIGFLDAGEVYQSWNNSPSHKANLFNPNYQDIGMAVLKGDFQGKETFVVVQLFGSSQIKPLAEEKPIEIKKESQPEEPKTALKPEEEVISKEEIAGKSEEKISLPLEDKEIENRFGFNFFRFLSSNYNDMVQKITFYSLLFITASLIINIFVKFNIQHKDLILKTLFFIGLLILFILSDKELMIRIIPHDFNIYPHTF